jgi:hypothetical protein
MNYYEFTYNATKLMFPSAFNLLSQSKLLMMYWGLMSPFLPFTHGE